MMAHVYMYCIVHVHVCTYVKKWEVVGEELGQVDVLDGAQHEDVLVLVGVLEFEVASCGQD